MATRGVPPPTRRLRFREFERADAPLVRQMLADEVAARIFRDVVELPDYGMRWVTKNLERYARDGFGLWALERISDGEFLGDCGLTIQHLGGAELLELGYHLKLEARGHGYATEAAFACHAYAFEIVGAECLYSIVRADNRASARVAARVHSRSESGHRKSDQDIVLYRTERSDWQGSKN